MEARSSPAETTRRLLTAPKLWQALAMKPFITCSACVIAASLTLGCSKDKPDPKAVASAAAAASAEASARRDPASDIRLLDVGVTIPKLVTTAHDGTEVSLEKLKGKPVVVYFYPKDDTPGCTVEAQQIRDNFDDLSKTGAVVLGVSSDSNDSHSEFAKKHSLPFKLLPDPDHVFANAFGVPIRDGHTARVTFVIDKQGKVAKVFAHVNPDGHAKELVAALQAL